MTTTPVFDRTSDAALTPGVRYISSCGGTRSGKTWANLQVFYFLLLGEERRHAAPTVNSVVSESMPHLKRGAIRDFQTMLKAEGVWQESRWNETSKTYTFGNGSILEFFSADDAGKVYGAARDRLFLNECQHIDYETARQLFVRTRGLILLDYNPTHRFWVMDHVEPRTNCVRIHSTYKDNIYLSAEQVREIEDNRDDANWWTVFGEGLVGRLEGLIYRYETIPALPEVTENNADTLEALEGLDFGFSTDPTARVHILADVKKRIAYIRERCYERHFQNRHIIADMEADEMLDGTVPVYADCAEPKSIADLNDAGFNVIACSKSAPVNSDKLRFQIQWMQGWKFYVTEDSPNVADELQNYCWAKDRNGAETGAPIDKYNHALDALRYALWTHYGENAGAGNYTISIATRRYVRH